MKFNYLPLPICQKICILKMELTLSADIALSLSEIPKTQKQHKSALILRTILKFSHTKQIKFFTRYLNLEFSFYRHCSSGERREAERSMEHKSRMWGFLKGPRRRVSRRYNYYVPFNAFVYVPFIRPFFITYFISTYLVCTILPTYLHKTKR